MATLTFRPAAGETSPADGFTGRLNTSTLMNFSTIRAATGNAWEASDPQLVARLTAHASSSGNYQWLTRNMVMFDTSSIPDNAVILSATLSLYGESKSAGLGQTTLEICSANPVATNNVTDVDYDVNRYGSTSFGNVAYASFNVGAYNHIALNDSGLANITKTGITKFGIRTGWDLNNNFTGSWAAGGVTEMRISAADVSGTAQDPQLVVEYYIPEANFFPFL